MPESIADRLEEPGENRGGFVFRNDHRDGAQSSRNPGMNEDTTTEKDPTSTHQIFRFNELPMDIAAQIITFALSPGSGYYHQIISLCMVCKAWNSFVKDAAELWTYIFSAHPTEFHELVVRRSRGRPLVVIYGSSADSELSQKGALLKKLVDGDWPVKSFQFVRRTYRLDNQLESLKLLVQTLPITTRILAFRGMRGAPVNLMKIGKLSEVGWQELQQLWLFRTAMPWATLSAPKLTRIVLNDCHHTTAWDLVSLLDLCPGLEMVWAQGLPGGAKRETDRYDRVCASRLHTLHLTGLSIDTAVELFQHLTAPALTKLAVDCSTSEPAAFSRLVNETTTHGGDGRYNSVIISSCIALEVLQGGRRVRMADHTCSTPEEVKEFLQNSVPVPLAQVVTRVHLDLDLPDDLNMVVGVLSDVFPAVVELSMVAGDIVTLRSPDTLPDLNWGLPKLHMLNIVDMQIDMKLLEGIVASVGPKFEDTPPRVLQLGVGWRDNLPADALEDILHVILTAFDTIEESSVSFEGKERERVAFDPSIGIYTAPSDTEDTTYIASKFVTDESSDDSDDSE